MAEDQEVVHIAFAVVVEVVPVVVIAAAVYSCFDWAHSLSIEAEAVLDSSWNSRSVFSLLQWYSNSSSPMSLTGSR